MRLHIVGIPSAGKTTLARDISARLEVPMHTLDGLAFIDERWTLRPAAERDAMLHRILQEPSFVSEGGFLGWTEPLFEAADHIVWLDPPLRVLAWRHLVRHWRRPLMLPSLLWFQWRMFVRAAGRGPLEGDPDVTRSGIALALRPYARKVYRMERSVGADAVIERLALVS
jgi:hypothetical protein